MESVCQMVFDRKHKSSIRESVNIRKRKNPEGRYPEKLHSLVIQNSVQTVSPKSGMCREEEGAGSWALNLSYY